MAEIYMTKDDRTNVAIIADVIKNLPPRELSFVYGVCQGIRFKNSENSSLSELAGVAASIDVDIEDKSNAKSNTNK